MTTDAPVPRLEGESLKWYSRFLEFIALPVENRSVRAVYDMERRHTASKGVTTSIPASWRSASIRFQWRERSEMFDRQQLEARVQRIRESHAREDERRFKLLRKARQTLDRVLSTLGSSQNLMRWGPGELLRGLAIMASLTREENKPGLKVSVEYSPAEYAETLQRIVGSSLAGLGFGQGLEEEEMKDDEPTGE